MVSEKYTFREANEDDFPKICSFFKKHNYQLGNEQSLRWKYLENPAGRGRIFLMEDSDKKIQGTLGYIPLNLFNLKSSPSIVMESVDLIFAPETRGKKMFPKIQKMAMNKIEGPLIAFPNRRAEEITLKLGWEKYAPIESWYFPIGLGRAPAKLPIYFTCKMVKLFCKFYAYLWLLGGPENNIRLIPVKKFRYDYSRMRHKRWIGRSAEFLNWRFIGNPSQHYNTFEFHASDELVGYCVLRKEGPAAVVYDFFVSRHQRSCLGYIVDYCRNEGYNRLVFRGVGLQLWRFGFVKWFPKVNLISYNLPLKARMLTLSDSDW